MIPDELEDFPNVGALVPTSLLDELYKHIADVENERDNLKRLNEDITRKLISANYSISIINNSISVIYGFPNIPPNRAEIEKHIRKSLNIIQTKEASNEMV